jgi:hypothetical protein
MSIHESAGLSTGSNEATIVALRHEVAVQAHEIARLTHLVESHTQWLRDHVATHQPECACGPCATWRQLTQANERVAALTAERDALKEKLQVSQGAYVNVFKERDALAAKVKAATVALKKIIQSHLDDGGPCPDPPPETMVCNCSEHIARRALVALEATP